MIDAREPVRIAIWDYQPFVDTQTEDNGLFTKHVIEILDLAGIPYVLEFYPWLRIEMMLQSGEIWASFPYVPTPSRLAKYDFLEIPGILTVNYVFYSSERRKSDLPDDWDSLDGFTFGVVPGYWYIDELEANGAEMLVVPDESDLPALLKAGRIDFAVLDVNVAKWICETDERVEIDDLKIYGPPNRIDLSYMAVSRSYPETQQLQQEFIDAGTRLDHQKEDFIESDPWKTENDE